MCMCMCMCVRGEVKIKTDKGVALLLLAFKGHYRLAWIQRMRSVALWVVAPLEPDATRAKCETSRRGVRRRAWA